MAVTFTPVVIAEFCQPDETIPFGRKIVQACKYLRIALPSITGTMIKALPEDQRWKIEVHVPGRTFDKITEPIDFHFISPTWPVGRDIAAHLTIGRIREEYRVDLYGSDGLSMVSRRGSDGEVIRTRKDDTIISHVQDLDEHIRTLEIQLSRSTKRVKQLMLREVELEDELREAHYEHEDEVKILLEKFEELKLQLAEVEEKLDQGENLHPDDSNGPFVSNDEDYEESTAEGGGIMDISSEEDN